MGLRMICYKKTIFLIGFISWPITIYAQRCQTADIPATTPVSRFITNSNETVKDTKTGLIWKICTEGQNGLDCKNGTAIMFTWQQALTQAKSINENGGFAGYSDWRVPNVKELVSISEKQCLDPGINLTLFPNTPDGGWFWTSSSFASNGKSAWSVNYSHGGSYEKSKESNDIYVRLVRG